MDATSTAPPHYVLISYNTLQHSASVQSSTTLAHADVEYRHTDDSPLALLPRHQDEHVLVLFHDPNDINNPTVRSTSSQFAFSGIKVLPAPGAGADEEDAERNTNMYVLQVTSTTDDHASMESSQTYLHNPHALVARFKQRNATIRHILEYCGAEKPTLDQTSRPEAPQ
ncbi:hypothetical protein ID866_8835 [Astraeus odoratus]|nr:hypothetical protein ID866_8835 [Astraeus odoratus]